MRAVLRNYRQSPRKVRLVADLIRNKEAQQAAIILDMAEKRAALPLKKLLQSAVANARHNDKADGHALFVKEIRVDEGPTLKRMRPRARGSAYTIRKRTSHIMLVLGEQEKGTVQTRPNGHSSGRKSKRKINKAKKA
ncbi:MAG: 50S ribosomal protein L22 [Patescibacteria group bacterium]